VTYILTFAVFVRKKALLGANFSYCSNTGYEFDFGNDARFLVGAVAQLEAKFTVADMPSFNAYSVYGEFILWLIPSDVAGAPTLVPKINIGLRIGLF